MTCRRSLLLSAVAAVAVPSVWAQGPYPQRAITFIVPWTAGGSNDILARTMQPLLKEQGLDVRVENVTGATGTIGLRRVAGAAPDGYTIGMGTSSTLAFMAQGKTPLKNEQFDHIARISVDPLLLLVPADSPHKTLEQFLAHMKRNPGKVSIGASGDFNTTHVLAAMTARSQGVGYVYVPYPGGARVVTDLGGGHVEAAILKPSESRAQIEAGNIRALGVYGDARLAALPDVPTFKEKGHDVFAFGPIVQMAYLVAPVGLPLEVRARLTEAFRKALRDPRFRQVADQNAFLVDDLTGDALTAEVTKVGKAIATVASRVLTS